MLYEALNHYYDCPYDFVCDVLLCSAFTGVYPTPQQEQVLRALEKYRFISVRSGHGVGKTAIEAWVGLWFMATRPHCKIPCTAPTQHQLYDVLWSEIQKWISSIGDERFKKMFEWTSTHVYNKKYPETWFAVARSCTKPENMQGFHADNLMFIIDEASGIPQNIMEVIQGALTGENSYCLMFGNPTQLSGAFYDSFHKDRAMWKNFHFSSEDSPLVKKDYVEKMRKKYGENSDIYRVRVLGDFPLQEEKTVISLADVEVAMHNNLTLNDIEKRSTLYIGVDVARYGSNKTVITIRQCMKVLSQKTYSLMSTMETAGWVMAEINKHPDLEIVVNIDDTGVGGGVTDRLRELNNRNNVYINGINNGSESSDPTLYDNIAAELWWFLRENIKSMEIPNDEDLAAQLCTRRWTMTSKGRIQLERKEQMTERGIESPDKADSLVLAFFNQKKNKSQVIW